MANLIHTTEKMHPKDLLPHPKNYRQHPPKQLKHLMESIKQHGFYRNIIVAEDLTILAGHGVVKAALQLKLESIPVIRLHITPTSPAALKVLAGDNEIANLGESDQKSLLDILTELKEADELFGTGFDVESIDGLFQKVDPHMFAEEHWAGMPEFTQEDQRAHRRLIVNFESEEDVRLFAEKIGATITDLTRWVWYPPQERERKDTEYLTDD
jgi:hypothetical protein